MPPTYRRLGTRFTCADLSDPFGFGRRSWPAHADVVSDADASRPPRTRPAGQH
jgi:hypothetical protein